MKIAYTFGVIDVLHFGHIRLLQRAKKENEINIFGLVNDLAAKEWLGFLVSEYNERKEVLKGVKYIDEIKMQKTISPIKNLEKINTEYPNSVITIYTAKKYANLIPKEFLKKINGEIEIIDYYEKLSNKNLLKSMDDINENQHKYANIISTKANTLLSLKEKLKKSVIEKIYITTLGEYRLKKEKILTEIKEKFLGEKIVVRSSSSNEDCFESSNAGHYESVLNVDSANSKEIHNAIELVLNSYALDNLFNSEEQVLIQRQTTNVLYSGVLFTRDINRNTPYYLINYDDNGSTDSVTSGEGGKTIFISQNSDLNNIPEQWKKLLASIHEIENLIENTVLDIEFAINNKNEVIIFQVRPLAANSKFDKSNNDILFLKKLSELKEKYCKITNIKEENETMLSDMAFWNPSEIIGSNPKKLDYTLYREIITKKTWNKGLVPLGYQEVKKDLMYQLGNKPYISVDDSFYSLLSADLGSKLSSKLVKFYKEKLKRNPKLHDKIEFLIIPNCYDFTTYKFMTELKENGFTSSEIFEFNNSLFKITRNYFMNFQDILKDDLKNLKKLELSRNLIELEEFNTIDDYVDSIKKLLDDLQKYGTSEFSRQARFAFIARTLCESLVIEGDISSENMNKFMLSIETIATEFENDFNSYLNNQFSDLDFYEKYGHLRSGTYDITAKRYDQINFEKTIKKEKKKKEKIDFDIDLNKITKRIAELELELSINDFFEIIKKSFEQREYFKFEFTKTLSLALELIAMLGKTLNFTRAEMANMSIYDIYSFKNYQGDVLEFAKTLLEKRKKNHDYNTEVILPEIIMSKECLDFIEISESKPNFITEKEISGEIIFLEENQEIEISDKIIVITKADPGFDWIFAKGIKGLITKYGGVASHMAIRCAEFGIPAAIGCGEKIYNDILRYNKLMLDCKNQRIKNEL